jgi:hypothetical protein
VSSADYLRVGKYIIEFLRCLHIIEVRERIMRFISTHV